MRFHPSVVLGVPLVFLLPMFALYCWENNDTVVMTEERNVLQCTERTAESRVERRGDYWVLYNYIKARRSFRCLESITYTTHTDYSYLDNLKPLVERWSGPVSVALHAPGTDMNNSLQAIRYAQDCLSPLISEYVTFHLYSATKYLLSSVPAAHSVLSEAVNCNDPAPWKNATLFKKQNKMLYPVNVGRNIARQEATTHYVLPSDIELYPSPGLIPVFLDMVRRQEPTGPVVYPLFIFEIEKTARPPDTKDELVSMLAKKTAVPFHIHTCLLCHKLPYMQQWREAVATPGMNIFHITKRHGAFKHWEPIFIGSHQDPLYDERFSWEGMSDKMTQAYIMCVMDYDFAMLDNAFLTHRPGIKYKTDFSSGRWQVVSATNKMKRNILRTELEVLFEKRVNCSI